MLGLFEHLERELDAAGFFHPPEKRPSMVQNLRSALGRASFTDQEVRTFRGVVTALSRGRGRVLHSSRPGTGAGTPGHQPLVRLMNREEARQRRLARRIRVIRLGQASVGPLDIGHRRARLEAEHAVRISNGPRLVAHVESVRLRRGRPVGHRAPWRMSHRATGAS